MTESGDISYQLYENGEVDYVGLGEARINTIAKTQAIRCTTTWYRMLHRNVPSSSTQLQQDEG